MYPTEDEKAIIEAAEKLMVDTMARYDPSHDAYHVRRVRKTALTIASALPIKPDLFVVELGAILHDVLDKKYVSAQLAADPYTFFLPFFEKHKSSIDLISDGRARLITQILDNVSWSTEKKRRQTGEWAQWHEECSELHCIQDADRLDAIGAFGVMRCAAYTVSINKPLHTPPHDPASGDSAIQHFHDKLIHIKERLKTEPGKLMGQRRHKLLLDFLASVEDEYECRE
ncbi:uncharacterized protein BT62DRAFT_883474 [Guyanagaster necrorhizus]|uniref:HD/PDEase domain-containing protein n=1 Tax=Guyanagaster necrorhizus TaxID=856835 RepID=A0A9P8AYV4_9AGAR|nr:uncharacterized protein BT62DRAFT_883474 [Guyanagaster necrorhizus MCA 3950]KAG7451312.1 hypothetical protein BT62DRAFT_883474 [Guyanagaster necrorhizus MCA 3950]